MNGHYNTYVIAGTWESYCIDRVWKSRVHYNSLTDARRVVKGINSMIIYKVHFDKHSGDVVYIMEVRK